MIDIDNLIEYSKDLTLLYVEDNADAREMSQMIFESIFKKVIVAEDGEEGFEKFKNNKVDLIITDINMPRLNGLEMCQKIREIDSEIPLIILSAHNEENFFIQSIEIGINGYLLKPIDLDQLLRLLFQITQRYQYKNEAEKNLNLMQTYQKATNLSSIVSKTDPKGLITYVNDQFCEISGYTREELIGKNHNIVRHPDNPKEMFEELWNTIKNKKIWKGIVRNKTKEGKSYYVDSLIMPIINLDGEIEEYISVRHDITDIMNPLKQLKDAITNATDPILIYIKLDRFTEIEEFYDNNTLEKIQEQAKEHIDTVFSQIFDFDTIYFLDNGEYAFVLERHKYIQEPNIRDFLKTLQNAQKTLKSKKIKLDDEIELDIETLISVAYEKNKILESVKIGIKKLLKNKKTFIVANNLAEIEQKIAKKNLETINMIKQAIKNSNIVSYFQPIVDNNTQKIVKYESLVRLIDDNNNVLTPYYFLDTAKKGNYYSKITNIVLDHSFNILQICSVDISINLSALDIEQASTRNRILFLLEKNKNDAHRIVFELLEDENVKDFAVVKEFISEVKEYGVKIAIDDFGAGYSNYERLLDYQPDILKIDGCLIRDIETSSYSLSAVKSIVTFAKEQNLETIAEFIENEDIFKIVKELGVDYSQGYYFGKPEPL
ncbi:MAG: EAL domain-containing protein [Epsilonproteobacteria bacterium]|nr:EAL domain-containing protein [Campylobacterota bacterium]